LAHEQGELAGALARILDGIGPRLAKEIAVRAQLSPSHSVDQLSAEQRAALWEAACHLFESALQHPSPHLYFDGDVPVDVAPIPLNLYEHLRGESRPTISQALDELCSLPKQTVDQEKLALQKNVRHHLVKASLALERVTRDLENTQEYERLRHEGELLLAHLSQIPKGASAVELEDFLDGTKKTIALDPALSPLENAQRKFERAKKLKRAQQKLAARAQELRQEVEYLAGVEGSLERAESPEDLAKLREELRARLRLDRTSSPAIGRRRRTVQTKSGREFLIGGYRVLVGRSSKENDELVRRASREDYWLHARDRPGAHVIVKNPTQREVPRDVLEQAAQLAAYYSKGRDAQKVPVSYTRVKYLRRGGRPGLVLMMHEEGTLLVTPKGDLCP
jgi:predicted ribosome quality control (RQC) complex YloA/Tae2 family protein